MKKQILTTFVAVAVLAGASSAFAVMTLDAEAPSTTIGGGIFKVSTNVVLTATATTTAYQAIAGHTQGDKEYATVSGDPKVGSKAKAVGVTPTEASAGLDMTAYTGN